MCRYSTFSTKTNHPVLTQPISNPQNQFSAPKFWSPGAFTSWDACVGALRSANASKGPFHSLTWYAPPAGPTRHVPPSPFDGECFGVRGTEWRPRVHQGVRSARGPGAAPGPCADEMDCELNGRCSADGACHCYPGWVGATCGVSDLPCNIRREGGHALETLEGREGIPLKH